MWLNRDARVFCCDPVKFDELIEECPCAIDVDLSNNAVFSRKFFTWR